MNSKIDIRIALILGFLSWAFTARAQAPVTDAGQVPPHVIKISSGYFGQMLGIKDYGDGDSLFGLVPLYVLDSSTLKLGTDTVITTGNVTSYAYSAVATSGSYKGLTEVDNTTVGLDLSILGSPLTITGTDRFAAWDPEGNANVVVLWSDMVSAMRDSIAGVEDGDKGDIDVTSSGTVWTIDTAAVDLASVKVTGTLPVGNGGTGLSSLGTAGQLLKVNSGATGLEYFTPSYLSGSGNDTEIAYFDGSSITSSDRIYTDGKKLKLKGSIANPVVFEVFDSTTGHSAFRIAHSNTSLTTHDWEVGIYFGGNSNKYSSTPEIYGHNGKVFFGQSTFFNSAIVTESTGRIITGTSGAKYIFNMSSEGVLSASKIRLYAKASNGNYTTWTDYVKSVVVDLNTLSPQNTKHYYGGSVAIQSGDTANDAATIPEKLYVEGNVKITGNFKNSDGSAATPSYSFDSDTNTGLFRPAADNLAISTAGTERLRVDASGNVGIGITPSVKFHVSGQSRIDGTFSVKGSGSTPFSTGSAAEMRWWNTTGGQWSSIVTDAGDWQLYDPSNEKLMSISNAGKHYVYVQDNSTHGYVLSGLDGNTYIQLVTTDGAENLRLGYPVSTSWVTLNAGVQVKYDGSRSSSFTVAPGDYILDVDATSAPVTVTLPASPNTGEVHIIIKKDSSANAITINGNGYNINGSASVTLASQYDRQTIVFTGADWRIID